MRIAVCLWLAAWGVGFWVPPTWAESRPSPGPTSLGISGVTVDVLPLQAPPGLVLPAPAAERIEMPPHLRSFRVAPRGGVVRPLPSPSTSAKRLVP
ncbi:MAG: hypothetical protein VKN33_00885 [Candidatus Sericytochromatia bacterium]|nr:hypothetical protein [Candidatus Sericytochromatia bacterium]